MRLRNASAAIVVMFLSSFLSLSWYTAWQNGKEKLMAYEREFHALRERLRVAEHRTLQRSSELSSILEQLRNTITDSRGSKQANTSTSDETQNLLKVLARKELLQVPNVYYHVPHLSNNPESLYPMVRVGQDRTGVSIVMGIPTVKREVRSYLVETLRSLIDRLSPEEKLDCVIVIFVGETDTDYVKSVVEGLQKHFSSEFSSGLLEVISPPRRYYPDFNNLRVTFGDSKDRVRWRTKQNLDYAFLMMYAVNKGLYYVQLEDDIIAKPNYFDTMKKFALQLSSEEWMILEFSQLGFIGKMFQSPDLNLIVEFILMFYKEKPIDWLLDHILWVKVCSPEKDDKHCERQKSSLRIRFRPSLFQHVGLHSSLTGKIQKLTDKDFLKPPLHKMHVNPPAELFTSMKVYQGHTLEKSYLGEDFFWATAPVAGDYIVFKFDQPVSIERYLFRSGNEEHPGDQIENTSIEILPYSDKELQTKDKYKLTEDKFYIIGQFTKGLAEAVVDPIFNPAAALRLTMTRNSSVWVILNEIHIKKLPRH
ncbi:alpha-1,3-mannosyl-glycoprotein 4-beta-N-acetylglucosaminyltransferase A-like isoform X2 [Paramormyrops kingsleyae]|uniref:Alpha-1,3-mannosyl-glycoprotein 4-beta-N-acetylglucosaminyltransferase A n=1 Tax=Paramormyrops kingsleyae TaxID=1676925 RepID=A0A3B3SP47_9TELE|nr:alpha-1,3-mannosyl-glycoprotein 4-beta-N-acetylglucosaminyltransferase A-like isoform X2 [Paramormyrops kingsleyae]